MSELKKNKRTRSDKGKTKTDKHRQKIREAVKKAKRETIKLSEADIGGIKYLRFVEGLTQQEIARIYNVNQGHVSRVLRGATRRAE